MRQILFLLGMLIGLICVLSNQVYASTKIGDVLFETAFDKPEVLKKWKGHENSYVSFDTGGVAITVPEGTKFASIQLPFEPEKFRGTRVKVTAKVKVENVVKPPQIYNGIKCMLHSKAPSGEKWQQQDNVYGTFDWQTIEFQAVLSSDITELALILGIENTTGKVWFEEVKISVIGVRRNPERFRKEEKVYKGHDQERLRGAMIAPEGFGPDDIAVLAGEWKANHVRWQLLWNGFPNGPADTATVEEYNEWMEKQLRRLDEMLPYCEKYGVYVLIDVHTPPGGRQSRDTGSAMRLFREKKFQDAFIATWEKIAKRYKDHPNVWGYDLLNEPVEGNIAEGLFDWRELALLCSKKIRQIDHERAIIIEPAPWGSPDSLEWFEPFDPVEVPNVVYSVHMYIPHNFTHQGVYDSNEGISYPGKIDGRDWNKEELRKALAPVVSFQNDYGVHIYLGEFSVIRWAPDESGPAYLRDCIELFEEYGWDWAYHAFREWDGWSLEHGPDKNDRTRTTRPGARARVVLDWFEKNQVKTHRSSIGR